LESDTKSRPSVLTKILGSQPEQSGPAEPRESGKGARQAIDTPMLDVALHDGRIESFSYAYLTRVSFTPGDRLVLHFGGDRVLIEGRNLHEIRQRIRLHREDLVVEGIEAESALKPESAAHIDSIAIDLEEEREKERESDSGKRKGFAR
jgi:hypothetical protein